MAAYDYLKPAGRLICIALYMAVIADCGAAQNQMPPTAKHTTGLNATPEDASGFDAAAPNRQADTGQAIIMQSWHGDYPVSQLERFPENLRHQAVGFIDNAETFSNLWDAFKPGEAMPDVDFQRELVLFARNIQFYNRISIGQVKLTNGVAEILALETLSAMPIEDKLALSLVKVSRQGITAIRTPEGPIDIYGRRNARIYVYECDPKYHFTAGIEGKKAWLFLPGQTVSLPELSSEAPATYGDGAMLLRIQGEEAELETGDGKVLHCTNNRVKAIWEAAKLKGVDFRAMGNEPGWHLEITASSKIVFVADYGSAVYAFNTPEAVTDLQARTTSYTIQNDRHHLEVLLEGRRCHDTMSDEAFETTVTVTLDGQAYYGCGKPLH